MLDHQSSERIFRIVTDSHPELGIHTRIRFFEYSKPDSLAGLLQDPPTPGVAASSEYNEQGGLIREDHFQEGAHTGTTIYDKPLRPRQGPKAPSRGVRPKVA
jgi:hypothetical protein